MYIHFRKQRLKFDEGVSIIQNGNNCSKDDEIFHYDGSLERLETHNIRLSRENELLKEQLRLKEDALRLHGIQIMSDVIHLLDKHHIECDKHRGTLIITHVGKISYIHIIFGKLFFESRPLLSRQQPMQIGMKPQNYL